MHIIYRRPREPWAALGKTRVSNNCFEKCPFFGTLKLIPPKYRFASLLADYEAMKDMLYGDVPDFNTIMDAVRQLEVEINSL